LGLPLMFDIPDAAFMGEKQPGEATNIHYSEISRKTVSRKNVFSKSKASLPSGIMIRLGFLEIEAKKDYWSKNL
jgi:hypothetical protein